MIDEKDFLQEYNNRTIMKEASGGTYMIIRKKKWYEKIIPDFIVPSEIVLATEVKSIEDAKFIIDQNRE